MLCHGAFGSHVISHFPKDTPPTVMSALASYRLELRTSSRTSCGNFSFPDNFSTSWTNLFWYRHEGDKNYAVLPPLTYH